MAESGTSASSVSPRRRRAAGEVARDVGVEPLAERGDVLGADLEPGRRRVPAVAFQQFVARLQRLVQARTRGCSGRSRSRPRPRRVLRHEMTSAGLP